MGDFNTIAKLPNDLRPYEKCERLGAGSLSDPELLAVIIRTGSRDKSSVALSEEILYPGSERTGLSRLMISEPEEYRRIKGVGRVKSLQLACIGELARRIAREKAATGITLNSPGSVAAYYMQELKFISEEEVHLALFDVKGRLIKSVLVSRGTVSCSVVSPREIFLSALKNRAACFIMVHNHPSGVPEPSMEDMRLSRTLCMLGAMMNIPMRDSIIIGDNSFVSMSERKLLEQRSFIN